MIYLHYDETTGEILNAADKNCFKENPRLKKKDPENYKPRTPEEPYIIVTREEWHEAVKPRKSRKIVDGKLVVSDLVSIADYDRAMEQHIAAARIERGYTTREPDAYLNSTVPRWKQDAEDFVAFRDEVMLYGLQVQNDYADGKPVPSLEEFKANLPVIHWNYGWAE